MDQQREMTLDEWVDRLPESHVARRELTDLRSQLAAANEAVRVLGEYAYWNDTDSAAKHLTSDSKLDAVNKRIEEAMRAVFNNPLARAAVEKAGKVGPTCVSCMGAGHMEGIKGNCPACKGTGIEKV